MYIIDTPYGIKRRVNDILGKVDGSSSGGYELNDYSVQGAMINTIRDIGKSLSGLNASGTGFRGSVNITGSYLTITVGGGYCVTSEGDVVYVTPEQIQLQSGPAYDIYVVSKGFSESGYKYDLTNGEKVYVKYDIDYEVVRLGYGESAPSNSAYIGTVAYHSGAIGGELEIRLASLTYGYTGYHTITDVNGDHHTFKFENGICLSISTS